MIMPTNVEQRLLQLSDALDDAQAELDQAEETYHLRKTAHELAMARSRLSMIDRKIKMTVTERDDRALVENAETLHALTVAEVMVRAARANVSRLRTQVDIARSLGASVRSSMDSLL